MKSASSTIRTGALSTPGWASASTGKIPHHGSLTWMTSTVPYVTAKGSLFPLRIWEPISPEELIAFRYQTNPNGSFRDIAGITDVSGQVLGMMPHPEAFIRAEQHPRRRENRSAEGLRIFENAVKYSARR
jgi:hypothetical protein